MAQNYSDMRIEYLRSRAEDILFHTPAIKDYLLSRETSDLIHELAIHQAELELQNEELRNTQNALLLARDRYAELFNSAPLGYLLLDSLGRIRQCNTTWSELAGVEGNDCIGKPLVEYLHIEDAKMFLARYRAFYRNPKNKILKVRIMSETGEEHLVQLEAKSHCFADANVVQTEPELVIVVLDITKGEIAEKALQETQQKINIFFEGMKEQAALFELNCNSDGLPIDYTITDCNRSFAGYHGKTREQLQGMSAKEFFRCSPPPHLNIYSWVAQSGEPCHYDYKDDAGRCFSVQVSSPKPNRFATLTTETTAIKKAHQALQAKNKELQGYLYIASHDLRSPLLNILGFSARIRKQVESLTELSQGLVEGSSNRLILEKSLPECFTRLDFNTQRLDKMIGAILEVSRTGLHTLKIVKVNVNSLLNSLMKGLAPMIDKAQAKIEILDLPECYGDYSLLEQLFGNLLENAIKYSSSERCLHIIIRGSASGDVCLYEVEDNGVGISAKHQERIWDLFFRGDAAKETAGTGVGLSITRRIAERHQGTVHLNTTKKTTPGCLFEVSLPNVKLEIPA
jgi:PAS domain S-box-containing protein